MGTVIVADINGLSTLVDSDAQTVPIESNRALGEGSKSLLDVCAWVTNHAPILGNVVSYGSGSIMTLSERNSLHSHGNKAALDTIPTPTAGQTNTYLKPSGSGTYSLAVFPTIPTSTDFRKGLAGNADLTGNSTGNAYLDGGSTMSAGDWFYITSNGTLTTNTGTNIAVSANDHVYINNDTTDSTIVDADLDVVTPAAAGVTSIDFGLGVQNGVIVMDADDIAEGTTNLWLTTAERTAITTDIPANAAAITQKLDTSVWTASAASSLTSSGSNAVITTNERATITAIQGAKTTGQVLKATGTGINDFSWGTDEAGGSGTVSSVNTVLPVAGDVTLTANNIAATASRLWLTPTQSSDIATTKLESAGNAAAIARMRTRQTLTDQATITWNANLGLKGIVTLAGNRTLALISNLAATDNEARLIVKQDAIGNRTLNLSAYKHPDGVDLVLSTAPNAVDILSFEIEDSSTIYCVGVKNLS